MASASSQITLDAFLDKIATGNKLIICSAQPTNYTEADSTYNLASIALTGGDFTKSTVNTADRMLTIGAKSGYTVNAEGSGNHGAIVNTIGSELLYVFAASSAKSILTGDPVNSNAMSVTIAQPV